MIVTFLNIAIELAKLNFQQFSYVAKYDIKKEKLKISAEACVTIVYARKLPPTHTQTRV